jgi:dCTP deaminase
MTVSVRSFAEDELSSCLQHWWDHPGAHGLLNDALIERFIKIEPMYKDVSPPGAISYGLSSYGYDVRVGYKFKVFTPVNCAVVDPKHVDNSVFVDIDQTPGGAHTLTQDENGDYRCQLCHKLLVLGKDIIDPPCLLSKPDHILIPPNSFALAETVEHFEIPRDVMVIGLGKSTYARVGIVLNITPLEPEWRGKITLEISNSTPLPVKVYCGQGICQLLFFKVPIDCLKSYADKKGVYQDQQGLTLPTVKPTPPEDALEGAHGVNLKELPPDQSLATMLELVSVVVTLEQIQAWSRQEKMLAAQWAWSVHLKAGDNNDVEVPPRPAHVPEPVGWLDP